MNSVTPHIASTEEIINFPQVQNGAPEVIAMPIISKIGPITPVIVNNRQLLNMFVEPAGIQRSDNISLKIALMLSRVSNLMVCRVSNTEVLPAIAIGADLSNEQDHQVLLNYIYYKDGEYYNDSACTDPFDDSLYALKVYSTDPNPTYQHLNFRKAGGKLNIGLCTGFNSVGNRVYEYYDFSLDIDALDGYGNSLYVENINSLQSKYHFEVATPILEQATLETVFNGEFAFWSDTTNIPYNHSLFDTQAARDGEMTYTPPTKTSSEVGTSQFVRTAINKMSKYRRDIKMPILFDAGLWDNRAMIAECLETVSKKRKSLGVFSCPISANTFNKVRAFYNSDALKRLLNTSDKLSSYLYTCAPFRVDRSLGFTQRIPFTVEYIMEVLTNKAGNMEFAPVFGKNTGRVNGANIGIVFYHSTDPEEIAIENDIDAPETEQLQRLSANPVVYDESLGYGYIVNNLTYQTPNLNNLSEENNRRFFNSIQFDVNRLLDDFLAKSNNAITREELKTVLDNYRLNTLDPLGYGLNKDTNDGNNGFRYDIEPYNPAKRNTLTLKVDVCFNDSIKYVNVLYRDVPVMNA